MSTPTLLEVAGHEVTVTHPDRLVFPEAGHTKLDLIRYYLATADGALRGVVGRPMILKRFKQDIHDEAFFQKRAPKNRPPLGRGRRRCATGPAAWPTRSSREAQPTWRTS